MARAHLARTEYRPQRAFARTVNRRVAPSLAEIELQPEAEVCPLLDDIRHTAWVTSSFNHSRRFNSHVADDVIAVTASRQRHTRRRLSDKMLVAFHQACDQADFKVADRLLSILDTLASAMRLPCAQRGSERRRVQKNVVAARVRRAAKRKTLFTIRYRTPLREPNWSRLLDLCRTADSIAIGDGKIMRSDLVQVTAITRAASGSMIGMPSRMGKASPPRWLISSPVAGS